jgi:hypothetical protein
MSVYGEHLFGRVQHVPGLFSVSTMFFHVNYVPLAPLRSYVVLDGSERGNAFQGVRIPLSFKSVLAGYLRGWLGTIAIFTGIVAAFAATSFYVGVGGGGIVVVLAAGAALFGVLWYVFTARSWWFLPVLLAYLAASAAVYHDVRTKVPDARQIPGAAPGTPERRKHDASYIGVVLISCAAAILYSLTRLLTPASYRKAVELGRLAGVPTEKVAAHFAGHWGTVPEEEPPGGGDSRTGAGQGG